MTITFTTSDFLSLAGKELLTQNLTCFLNQNSSLSFAKSLGTSIDYSLKTTILSVLFLNSLVGKSSDLLYAFINTLQMIDYFPLIEL